MIKSKFAPIVLLLTFILFFPVWVQAADIQLSPDGTIPGTPFEQLQAQIDALTGRVDALEVENVEQAGYISTLQAQVADLQSGAAALAVIFDGVHRTDNDIFFDEVNVHIRNGLGETDGVQDGEFTILGEVNGLGNLIIGYNEERPEEEAVNDKTGSHNLVVGPQHNYPSFGGLVAGGKNTISGILSTVSGGFENTANGIISSVTGGEDNEASNTGSSVTGGQGNSASGKESSVTGGEANKASGEASSVIGGNGNTASGQRASVTGGFANTASGGSSSISGGFLNTASGGSSSISGGHSNTASGQASGVTGGQANKAIGNDSSVSGGFVNTASGEISSVSGGSGRSAPNLVDWAAGSLFEDH